MKNSPTRYGLVTKVLHWTVFVMILNQFVVAAMMLNTQGQTTARFTQGTLSKVAEWTHIVTAWILLATLIAHWTLGIRHQWRHRDRYLHRMLPFTHQR